MSGPAHIEPDRWALLASGELGDEERVALEAHLRDCASCTEARRRVLEARRTLDMLGDEPAPELNWDRLGARLHWTVSSELKRREREREDGVSRRGWARRAIPLALAGAAAAAVAIAVVTVYVARGDKQSIAEVPPKVLVTPPVEPAPVEAVVPVVAVPLEGVVTVVGGEVTIDGAAAGIDTPIRAGSTIVTKNGRLGVQFGPANAFVVERETELTVAVFDDREVALRIDGGAVAVDITRRSAEQRFAVVAGARAVEVRGTAFRVADDGKVLDVAVTRGRVAVLEEGSAVEIPAGSRLIVERIAALATALPRPMLADEAEDLQISAPMLPGWVSARELRDATSKVAVAARPGALVRLDGVAIGSGNVTVRATPGRHLVEVGSASRWIEVEPGASADASFVDRGARSERPAQVEKQLEAHEARIYRCAKPMQKIDPRYSAMIEIEIGVLADGSVNYVQPVRGLIEREVEECVLSVVRDHFTFPAGTKAEVRKTIRLGR